MGVHGLWQLLSSTGKPVPLDSLEGKVLAVDVSVWLHQLSKGMRDSSGNPLPNAHLHGLFTRICKLLYYRIKPVFVFDGGVPTLKKQTLASRRNKREDAERTSSQMQQKILTNLIRSQALKEACGLDKLPDLPQPSKSSAKGNKEALYQLPPIPEASRSYLSQKNVEDETEIDRWELQQMVEDEYEDINKIDVESEDFKALPAEVQHEVITDMRLNKKNYNLARIVDLPDDSKDFSNYQMAKLVKHNRLNTRLDEIRKELNERQTRSLAKNYGKRFENVDDIYSQRVISDDSSHYILAKRNLQKRREEEEKELEKPKIENVHEKLEVIYETDELLLDSDEESCEEVDIMEESRLIFEEISGKNDENGEIVEQRCETAKNKQIGKENEKSFTPTQREKIVENKPRFRAVIEVESDSDSESSDENVEQIESTENEVIVVDGGTVDTELQFAIEQSLKEQRKNTKSKDLNNLSDNISRKKSKDLEVCNKLDEKSESQCVPAITATKKESTDVKGQRAFGKKSSLKNSKSVGNKSYKDTEKAIDKGNEISNYVKRVDRIDEVHTTLRAETESPVVMKESKTKAGVFKRKVSCLSNGSADSEEGLSKIQRLDSSDIDSVIAVENEESSESEGEFIEVNIDLTKVKEDEMFPASMFDTAVTSANDQVHVESDEEVDLVDLVEDTSANTDNKTDVARKFNQELSWNKPEKSELEVEERMPQIRDADTEDSKVDAEIEESIKVIEKEDDFENEVEEKVNEDVERLVEDDTAEAEEDHVSMVTEVDMTSPDPRERAEIVERRRKRPSSPAITSLVRQFESINEQHVKGLRENIASENRQLRLEQGKQERLAISITDQMHAEAQELLQLFGIPYIVSPTEAEAQCAQLELIKLTSGTITDDSDIWLFGGRCVFKNFFNQQKHVECFRDVNINAQLGLNRESLINIALLCGSDYTEGIRGVGPVTAMEILAKFPGAGIEGLAKFKTWWEDAQREIRVPVKQSKLLAKLRNLDIHEGFPNTQVVEAYLSPTVDDSKEKFSWSLPDLQELRLFASSKLKWTREKTDEVLLPVLKRLAENRTQKSITAFFQPEIYMNPAPVKSKRLQKVVNKFVHPDEAEDDSENEQNEVKKKRLKGQKDQVDTENGQNEASKKKGPKGQKSQFGNKGQTNYSEMKDTDKPIKSRKTRSSTKIQSQTESVNKSEQKNVNSAKSKDLGQERKMSDGEEVMDPNQNENTTEAREGKTTTGRGSRSGRGRRGGGSSAKVRSKVIETKTSSSDSSSSVDSESDFSASDSDYGDESLAEKEGRDEEAVIETSLNITEILSLKMGCNINELKAGKESKQKEKVYENVINVNEILHLESGSCNAVNEIKKETCLPDDVNKTVVKSKANLSENLNVKKEIKVEELVNEGGFSLQGRMEKKVSSGTEYKISKIDDSANIEASAGCTMIMKDSDMKSDAVQLSVTKNTYPEKETSVESSVIKNCKQGSKRTRSSRTNSRRDESVESKPGLKNTESIEMKETDEVKKACLDSDVTSNPGEIKGSDKTNVVKTVALATVKPIQSKGNKVKLKPPVKEECIVYSNDPIKQLVSGLPWAEKGKGRRRVGGKGQGRAKVQKITPMETFVKKSKPKESKRTFGSVNLSESDSDESE